MRLLRQRKKNRVDRRMALHGVPTLHPGVELEEMDDGNVRVTMTIKRGSGFFERMRPPKTRRSYDLDEFGSFVARLVDGKRTVLDVVDAFEKQFKMSRREVELSVVAFFKLLMQRNVLSVAVSKKGGSAGAATGIMLLAATLFLPCRAEAADPAYGGVNPELATPKAWGQPYQAEGMEDAAATLASIRSLSDATGSRLPGSPGNLALEELVEKRFKDSGFETGEIRFNVPIFSPGSLELDCGEDGKFELEAMHPALMRPGNFPQSDFDTRLLYLGQGRMADLERMKGIDLAGAIAVMDYSCGDRWMDILRFDVAGIVFVQTGAAPYEQSLEKVYNSEVAVPRFYIDGDAGKRLRALAVDRPGIKTHARSVPCRWRRGQLRDLWVLIPGADEALAERVVVLTAPLDANSVVPSRSTGAQRAVNLHVLLKLLDDFKDRPPRHSVILVAVNAHTQRYAGERQLAWHLMAPETDVETMRDEIATEMRMARLHASEYGKLHLDPVPEKDKPRLHVVVEILWKLDERQAAERKVAYEAALERREAAIKAAQEKGEGAKALEEIPLPELDEVLDLDAFTEMDIRNAMGEARDAMLKAYRGFFAKQGRDPKEVEKEKQEDLAILEELASMPHAQLMEVMRRAKSVFDDEKLFERWRGTINKSTGRRIYVKTMLQDEFKGAVNRTMQDILVVSSTNMTTMAQTEREEKIAKLEKRRDQLRNVLVLFNKMDIGVGRTRTRYRQIAVNDVLRSILKEAVDKFVEQQTRWERLHAASLELDAAGGKIRETLGRRKVELALALELDGHAERVGLSSEAFRVGPGWFKGFAATCVDIATNIVAGEEQSSPYVDALSGDSGNKPAHYFSMPDSGIGYFIGADKTPAFALKSAFANRGRLFGPNDSVDKLDPQREHALQAWVRRFIAALLDSEDILSASSLKDPKPRNTSWSLLMRTYSLEQFSGKPIPTLPIPDCMVAMYDRWDRPAIIGGDVVNCFMGITDDTANLLFYGMTERRTLAPLAYVMDEGFREVLWALDKGRVQSSKQISSNVSPSLRTTIPMFECREFMIKDRRDPSMLSSKPIAIQRVWPKVAKGQSDPEKYGVHGAHSLSRARSHQATGPIGIYLYRRRKEMRQDRLMIITDNKRCVLNATEENPRGIGFASQEELGGDILRRAAHDMAILNRSRNANMKGVVNQLLDEFMARGEKLNEEAEACKTAHDHVGYLSKIYEAFGNHVKAYRELQTMNADMLKAVIAYMALMLPFCFFLQKLLFNFKRLEHELAGFSFLFFGTFILFRFIHPAFRMAMCPEAIFIAFILGAIGVFTTGVLRSRFNEEMALLFRGVGGIGEEVGYGTVGTTAMLIGVQNMRRRRVRTTLTTATIVLVVFTMLAFSSVSRKAKPTLIPKAESAPYTGLFYHWPGGNPVDEATYKAIREIFADRADVKVRRILKRNEPWRMELADDPDTFISVKVVTGLPLNDGALRDSMALVRGDQFSSRYAEEILLPISAADALNLRPADIGKARVRVLGRDWLLRGLVDDQRYRLARDLNPNLPLIPFATPPKQDKDDDKDSLDVEVPDVTDLLMETEALVIIPEGIAAELGARPRSISVAFPRVPGDLNLGEEIRRVLNVTAAKFYVGSRTEFKLDEEASVPVKPGVYYVGSSYRTAIGGLAKLIIPLIIAGSIILNTMLGTVYERKSEIAVFNAIGLNPTHIFMFFLAEATVYSFIGAVGGYLIGQIITIVLKSANLIGNVNINFSSLMVVYAVLFTMVLVILSTLYPGYVATRTAVPSGKRKWSMPEHDGEHMSVVFPFIYQPRLAYGVMHYLQQFFEPLSDEAMGDIVAKLQGVESSKDADGHQELSLRYHLALSPYDLGVTQNVTFVTRYDEVVKSHRLHMEVDRVSGRDTNWVTTNKPFLERMRKFLIRWRNIDPTRQAWFVKHAEKMFRDGVPPEVEPPSPKASASAEATADKTACQGEKEEA